MGGGESEGEVMLTNLRQGVRGSYSLYVYDATVLQNRRIKIYLRKILTKIKEQM